MPHSYGDHPISQKANVARGFVWPVEAIRRPLQTGESVFAVCE